MRATTCCVILSVMVATGLAAQETGSRTEPRPISIVTGDDFWPFSDRDALDGGVLNTVVRAAMQQAAPGPGFAMHRIEDWTAHRDPLLSNALLDLGFPWPKPDCEAEPVPQGCADFLFSAPTF